MPGRTVQLLNLGLDLYGPNDMRMPSRFKTRRQAAVKVTTAVERMAQGNKVLA
jgi:hypothetical protein